MRTTSRKDEGEHGGVMILALFITIFAVGVVVSGSMTMKANSARVDTAFLLTSQVSEFARSGMIEAKAWFRRQPSQPVVHFAPQLDLGADPPIRDTEDPAIGLVREFRISGNVYGRYEIWKKWDADPDPVRLAMRQKYQAEDVSAKRGTGGAGTAWLIRCVAYVFVQRDDAKSFRQYPNYVIATEILESEMSRMSFHLPGQAALCVRDASKVWINENARIDGGFDGVGLYCKSGTGSPNLDDDGDLVGTAPTAPSSLYDDSTAYIFGVTDDRLNAMADTYLTDEAHFPAKIETGTMTILDSPSKVHFTASRPLSGYGMVLIRGDVEIDAGSSSFFYGVLYVDGKLTIHAPAQIHGAVIVTKDFTAAGLADYVDVKYDDDVIQYMHATLASYRTSRAPRRRRGTD